MTIITIYILNCLYQMHQCQIEVYKIIFFYLGCPLGGMYAYKAHAYLL